MQNAIDFYPLNRRISFWYGPSDKPDNILIPVKIRSFEITEVDLSAHIHAVTFRADHGEIMFSIDSKREGNRFNSREKKIELCLQGCANPLFYTDCSILSRDRISLRKENDTISASAEYLQKDTMKKFRAHFMVTSLFRDTTFSCDLRIDTRWRHFDPFMETFLLDYRKWMNT